jgi:RNA 3'-terminal phosphate cyclase (ATP)
MIEIDGSQGEGGGQVLRTTLGLSALTGKPVTVTNIRANRSPPGLRAQHVVAVEAAAAVGDAEVEGAALGARRLVFRPRAVRTGHHAFKIGTAGSATLVLQTVLPALLRADGPTQLLLQGGTHNPLAPPYEFLARAYLPLLERMGPKVTAILDRPGFYPAGGGQLRVEVQPAARLEPLELLERGEVKAVRARAIVSRLPRDIAERELAVVRRRLRWPEEALVVVEEERARGPGNALILEVEHARGVEVFSGFGERGVRAEEVARAAVDELEAWLEADVPVGEHLADQLLLLLALAGGGSFRTLPLSGHAATQIDVIRRFLPVQIDVTEVGRAREVRVRPG